MNSLRVLLKFVREGSVVECVNPEILISNMPSNGDLVFINVSIISNKINISNDEEKEGYKIKPFKVYQIIHVSHIDFGDLKNYDAIISLNTEYLDVIKITEDVNNSHKIKNKKHNKLT